MAASPTHESDVEPFWEGQAVFDPDGGGAEFAYTIGLHTRGLPELHIWAHPSLGDGSGADWTLSTRDRIGVRNELAALPVPRARRSRKPGDAGVRRRPRPCGVPGRPTRHREQLEALGCRTGSPLLPVRWSLHRAPEGALLGQGFFELLEHHLNPSRLPSQGGSPFTLVVTIGLDALRSGVGAGTRETGELRRLGCRAGIIPMVLGGDSVVLDMGREQRLVDPVPAPRAGPAVRRMCHRRL